MIVYILIHVNNSSMYINIYCLKQVCNLIAINLNINTNEHVCTYNHLLFFVSSVNVG